MLNDCGSGKGEKQRTKTFEKKTLFDKRCNLRSRM